MVLIFIILSFIYICPCVAVWRTPSISVIIVAQCLFSLAYFSFIGEPLDIFYNILTSYNKKNTEKLGTELELNADDDLNRFEKIHIGNCAIAASGLDNALALEDRIRNIRAKNDKIRRRQLEVEADRLQYT